MRNLETMRRQLRSMGASFDWDAEVVTCDPTYYRWNQWLFLRFLEAGLAYRATSPVDWCPNDGTLAREQVEGVDRHCWRCGARVEKRDLEQWYLRITKYADELLDFTGIDWPEPIRVMQTNWIGRSRGRRDRLPQRPRRPSRRRRRDPGLHDPPRHAVRGHVHGPRARAPARGDADVARPARRSSTAYVEQAGRATEIERLSTERDKTGVPLGADAINPVNGERIPIWIADYVLSGYGTGAIMAVPAHDERDFAFARQFGLEIREVVRPVASYGDEAPLDEAYVSQDGRRRPGQLRPLQRDGGPDGDPRHHRRPRGPRRGQGRGHLPAPRLARQPPALLGHADPGRLLRRLRDRAGPRRPAAGPAARRRSTTGARGENPLKRDESFLDVACPRCGGRGPARDRHAWTRSSTRRGTGSATSRPARRTARSTARCSTAGRRSTSTRAAPSTPSCTCCTAASSPRRWPTAASSATASRSCGSSTRARSWVPTASG